jgi:thiamine-monophosphate kinase
VAHLCAESGVAAEIDAEALPLHPLAAACGAERALELALHGGEDYELLFAAAAETAMQRRIGGVPVTCIGRLMRRRSGRSEVALRSVNGRVRPLAPGGWQHLT